MLPGQANPPYSFATIVRRSIAHWSAWRNDWSCRAGLESVGRGSAGEAQVHEAAAGRRDRLEPVVAAQQTEVAGSQAGGRVQQAGLEVAGHLRWVTIGDEVDLVHARPAGPVVLVRAQADLLAGRERDELEGAVAGIVHGRHRLVVRRVHIRPHVLRQDRDPQRVHVRLGLTEREDDGLVVGGLHRLDPGRQRRVGRHLVVHHPVVGEHDVLGRDRLSVLPRRAGADLERPREPVVAVRPALGELRP